MSDPLAMIRAALPAGFTLERQLGSGGQGAVFLGERGGEKVALKLFNGGSPERIQRELELLSRVRHENLVCLIDFHLLSIAGGGVVPMAVYEFIDGGDLRQSVEGPDAFLESELCTLGSQVGGAVQALWSDRIVHRDIKPANIMFDEVKNRYVLVDVGFAQHLDLSTITAPAGQPGTSGYRSPEQCGGRKRLTIHSDVFSFGVTLYEVAAKKHPWNRNQSLMGTTAPHPLGTARSDLKPPTSALIHQMMSARPSRRPAAPGKRFHRLLRGT